MAIAAPVFCSGSGLSDLLFRCIVSHRPSYRTSRFNSRPVIRDRKARLLFVLFFLVKTPHLCPSHHRTDGLTGRIRTLVHFWISPIIWAILKGSRRWRINNLSQLTELAGPLLDRLSSMQTQRARPQTLPFDWEFHLHSQQSIFTGASPDR